MKWKRVLAVLGCATVCGGLFILLFFERKAIVPYGQPPFFLHLCELALFLAGLLIAAVSDVKNREIPNAAPLLLFAAGALKLALAPSMPVLLSALLGAFLGGFPLLILALFSHSIGGGDVKLAASAGLALGWLGSYLALLVGLVGFVLYGCAKCAGRKKPDAATKKIKAAFPFAPAYAVGCAAVLIFSCILRRSFIL
ncbi:MAG: A24 family peptidase [Ethanoligenens sp.]